MNRLRILFLGALALALVAGTVINLSAQESHEAVIQVMVKRAQLERVNGASEDSKNRWVWVRDGLELKNQLVSDDVLNRVITSAGIPSLPIATFRKTVNVHYSGGDDNLYTIRVKNEKSEQAVALATAFIKEFSPLAVEARTRALADSIRAIESQPISTSDESTRARRAEMIETLRGDLAFANAENASRIIVVSQPHEARKIWPRPLFVYAASALIAMFLAALIAVALRVKRS